MLVKLYKSQIPLVVVILCAGIFILFREVFTLGYVQVPGDILLADPVFSEETPEEFDRPSNSLLFDPLYQFYVWHSVAARVMKETGRIPLWNPFVLAGQPLVANFQSALFYPPNLLLFRFSPEIVATLRVFINIFIAGLFTFLFSRELGVSWNAAVLAAIAFAFSGSVMVGPSLPSAGSLIWLPMVMWAGEKILQQKRVYFWGLICGLGFGLSILAGHPETVFHNGLVFLGYFSWRISTLDETWRNRTRITLPFFSAVGIGLLISAVQWLPFAGFLADSGIKSRGVGVVGEPVFFTPTWLQNFSLVITLLFPNFFGNPVDFTYYWPFSSYQNFLEQAMYFGSIPFALAVGAVFAKRDRKSPVIPLAILALLFLFTALRFPFFEGLNHLPVFNAVNNTRLKWQFSFLGAILAGFGLDALRAYFLEGRKENKNAVYGTVVIILIGLIFLVILLVNRYVVAPRYGVYNFMLDINLLKDIDGKLPVRSLVSIFALVVVALGFYFLRWNAKNFRAFEWLVLLATFFELIGVARGYNTTVPQETLHPDIKLVKRLSKDESLFRIAGIPPTFWPNIGALFGLYHVGGSDLPIYKWNMDVYSAQDGGGYSQIWQPDWPLLDWMNVKYVISPIEIDSPKYEAFIIRERYGVYLNKDVLPRAFMVYKVDVMKDRQEMLNRLVSGDFNFKSEVLLEQDIPEEQNRSIEIPESSESDYPQAVKFDVYDNDMLELSVETENPGMLVMSEVYAPGWIAKIDGEKTQLYRANYAYRAVYVSAGRHKITMEYKPVEFQIGSWLTLLGIIFLVVGLPLLGLNLKSRRSQRDELTIHQGQEYLESM